MNYFEWFGLPERLDLSEADLRRLYLQRSRQFHPDFYTLESEAVQQEALQQATFNNQAYRALQTLGGRMRYLLETHGHWQEGQSPKLPMDFLMEMMDWQEQWAEATTEAQRQALLADLNEKQTELKDQYQALLVDFQADRASDADWQALRVFYGQWIYLERASSGAV